MKRGQASIFISLACLLDSVAFAQVSPAPSPPPPQPPLAPLPDIGIPWPELGKPLVVVPLAPDPSEPAPVPGTGAAAPVADGIASPAPLPAGTPYADPGHSGADEIAQTTGERRYSVSLYGIEDISDPLFEQRFSTLSALKQGEGKSANVAQINRRAREDEALLDRLMRAKGYYDAQIVHSVAPAEDGGERLVVRFDIVPGGLYRLSDVKIDSLAGTGSHEPALRQAFPVKIGDPVDADAIIAAQTSLAVRLGEEGFPFAKVQDPEVTVDHESRDGQLAMAVATGGYRRFGAIRVPGNRPFDAKHVQLIARFRPDDQFMATDIEDLRRALIATGLVSSVTLTPKDAGDSEHVDIEAALTPAPPRTIAGALGYGTGEGFRAEASWQHRNFFPPEGAVTLRGVLGTQEQSGAVTFRRNNFRRRDQVLNAQLSAGNIHRSAYDARTIGLTGNLERQSNIIFQKKWTWSIGGELLASDERDTSGPLGTAARRTYFIGAVPGMLTYDGSDNLLDPTRGFRLGGRISPELSFQNSTFGYARLQIDGSFYFPARQSVVVAGRIRLGTIIGSSASRIAPSRRFYAGGGGSVRGYGYQQIGPRDINNDPIGGKSLAEFSLEARVRLKAFGGNFGLVPFLDGGNISTGGLPKFDNLRFGAGIGVRYYSNFGPIRVDVGTPLNPAKGDPRIAVYVSLGQAF